MTNPSWSDYGTYDESAHPDLWNGVVGYWAPCLGPTGTRLHDLSRRNSWGTLTNMDAATDWVVNSGQYALDLDGSNDRIEIPTISIANQVTVSAWCLFRSLSQEMIFIKQPTNGEFLMMVESNNLIWRTGLSPNVSFSVAGRTNEWLFVAGTIRGTSGLLYLNGVEVASNTLGQAIPSGTGLINWGAYSDFGGGYYLDGLMDQMCVHNRALSANEIRQLYQLGRGGMLQRRSRRRGYVQQAAFRAHYATQRNAKLIGGGLR